jgi:hypothetical protein
MFVVTVLHPGDYCHVVKLQGIYLSTLIRALTFWQYKFCSTSVKSYKAIAKLIIDHEPSTTSCSVDRIHS